MATATIDAKKDIAKRMTLKLKVKRSREFGIRLWVGIQLIKLAGLIMWMDTDVKVEPTTSGGYQPEDGNSKRSEPPGAE